MASGNIGRIAFLLVVAAMILAVFFTPLGEWLTVERLRDSRLWLIGLIEARPLLYGGGYFLLCVTLSALCFPAAPIVGVTAGALFGFGPGLAIVGTAWPIGSTLAFLASRHLLRDWVKRRFARQLEAIDRGFDRHGAVYLLSLRWNPVIPYWLVNLAMGVTAMRLAKYVPLTIIGLFPATYIYVTAGSQLATMERASDLVSMRLMIALFLISLMPLVVERLRIWLERRSGAPS